MSACNCCENPPGATPQISWGSASSSKSKCGFSFEGVRWRTRIIDTEFTAGSGPACDCREPFYVGYSLVPIYADVVISTRTDYDSACAISSQNTIANQLMSYECSDGVSGFPCCQPHGGPTCPSSTNTTTYDNEFTTEELISEATEAIGAYVGTTPGSFRSLPSDQLSIALRKSQYRINHQRPGTCYLKVWLRQKTQPFPTGTATYIDIPAYVWTGSGNPCLADPLAGVNASVNLVASPPIEIPIPETNATVTVEVVKWSYLPDYEPTSSAHNGYPDPY